METPDILPSSQDPRIGQAGPAPGRAPSAPQVGESSPAFRALLERLEGQTRNLQQGSRTVDGPEPLREAVAEAGSTLDAALSLGDQLIEAYRESIQRGEDPELPL